MAKFVRISLATKFRLLFGAAVLGIIAAALVVPWYFMELLAQQGVERPAAELTQLAAAEWLQKHPDPQMRAKFGEVAQYYASNQPQRFEGMRQGPTFIKLKDFAGRLEAPGNQARRRFERSKDTLSIIGAEDDQGREMYACFRAVRATDNCMSCHGAPAAGMPRFEAGELVGMIRMTMPPASATDSIIWWTRGAIAAGGVLATVLALITFSIITQRLILRPVRQLRSVADKVTEGDLAVRSTIATGDELQRLGESFNEMLAAISQQHEKLTAANRALDLRLHELAEANVTLYEANRVKNEFLANVSHELRTPLNSIIGFADLLSGSADEKTARYGQNICSAAKNLLAMINDVLDLAKIEAGKADVRIDAVSITDTCQTLAALMQPLADKRQLEFIQKLDPQVPLVQTDGGKVQQVLYNLLSNAIKFTPPGGKVMLSTTTETAQRSGQAVQEVLITVADTGPGIAEADQARIFDKFFQIDRSLTKESAGTGLGLAISRELTNLLGGRLSVKSSPGAGAEFTLALPIARLPAAKADLATADGPTA
jgi:signal transduction histidine kinase